MNRFQSQDLRQRFETAVFAVMAIAGSILMLFLNLAIAEFATDYTRHYWQEHTQTFADSVKYSLIMHAASGSEDIARHFTVDKTVLKASIYSNPQRVLASAGGNETCPSTQNPPISQGSFTDTPDFWCFYAPVIQDGKGIGYVELVVSKQELKAVLLHIRWISGLMVLAILVILYAAVTRFSSRFTRTMVELSSVLKNVSLGIPGQQVAFSGSADLAPMRDTFNDMLTRIESNERELEQKISEKTQALAKALESSEAANHYKSYIIAAVSHEMKTPLHAIGAYLELTAASLPPDACYDSIREFHRRGLLRVGELNDLICNILLHGKLNAKMVEAAFKPLAIEPLMLACAEKLAPSLERQQNRLKLSGEQLSVISDAELLTHVVTNMLSNACKFTSAGDITLSWWQTASDLLIQVSDTGCGIPESCYDKIFDSFWQVDMSSTRAYGGTGLGLAITKQCVDLLGGIITVRANGAQGSVFEVKIPNR